MNKDHGLVGTNHRMYLFYDFKYPNLDLVNHLDGKIKLEDHDKMIKEMYIKESFAGLIEKI